MNEDDCVDCILGREELGVQWCPVHYDWEKDNQRAIEQTAEPL